MARVSGSRAAVAVLCVAAVCGAVSCASSGTSSPPPASSCPRESSDSTPYRLTFHASWIATSHPTNFPGNAHFSPLVGGVHDGGHSFWRRGGTATTGIERMAEDGATTPLRREMAAVRPAASFVGGGIGNTDGGTATIDFRASQRCPLATFVSMVAPSHDWFVGVSGMNLRDASGRFVDHTVDVFVYDAGTEDGEDFSFNGPPTTPRGTITRLTTAAADTDFAGGVHRSTGVFVGRFVFEVQPATTLAAPRMTAVPAAIDRTGGVSTVTVTRPAAGAAGDMVVPLTFGGSAVRDADYRASADRVMIAAGERSAEMTLTSTMRPARGEPDKTIVITAAGRPAVTATVTITDMAANAGIHHAILPEAARAIVDHGMRVVAGRVEQLRADAGAEERRVTVAGRSTPAGMLAAHGRAVAGGTASLKNLLGRSDFKFPLTAHAADGTPGRVTLWGGGDYRHLEGAGGAADWDGGLFSASLGVDARLRRDTLAGLAVSWNQGEFDALLRGRDRRVDYALDLVGVHPYAGWVAPDERLELWVTGGYGWGEAEIVDPMRGRYSSDVEMRTAGVGGSGRVWESRTTTFRVKGEISHVTMDVDGGASELNVEARRMRMTLHGVHRRTLAGGARLEPAIEAGVRHDAGDGRTGTGAEVGGGLRYADAGRGLTLESRGRVLLAHNGGYENWGIGGMVTLDPGIIGRGMFFSLAPTVGDTAGRVSRLWVQNHAVVPATGAAIPRGRMDVRLGYVLGRHETLVTPYGMLTLTDGQARVYRLGGRWRVGDELTIGLVGTRREAVRVPMAHGVKLKVGLRW